MKFQMALSRKQDPNTITSTKEYSIPGIKTLAQAVSWGNNIARLHNKEVPKDQKLMVHHILPIEFQGA